MFSDHRSDYIWKKPATALVFHFLVNYFCHELLYGLQINDWKVHSKGLQCSNTLWLWSSVNPDDDLALFSFCCLIIDLKNHIMINRLYINQLQTNSVIPFMASFLNITFGKIKWKLKQTFPISLTLKFWNNISKINNTARLILVRIFEHGSTYIYINYKTTRHASLSKYNDTILLSIECSGFIFLYSRLHWSWS